MPLIKYVYIIYIILCVVHGDKVIEVNSQKLLGLYMYIDKELNYWTCGCNMQETGAKNWSSKEN